MSPKENARQYTRRMIVAAVTYTAFTLFSGFMSRQLPDESAWRIPLALLPVLPAAGMLYAMISFVKRLDELEQRIHLLTVAIVLGVIVIGCITYGFLQAYAGFPGMNGFVVGIGGIVGWSFGQMLVRRIYQ